MLAFIAQIVLNIALIPTMGMTGAAIGSTLSCIILNFFAYRFIKGKMKIKASFFN
jgi:O-antigen/teichoic acid export membrane protein